MCVCLCACLRVCVCVCVCQAVMSLSNINSALATTSVPQITALAPLVVSCPDGWGVSADGKHLLKRRGGKDWLRRKFQLFTASKASVLALQSGSTFEKWDSPYDEDYRCE